MDDAMNNMSDEEREIIYREHIRRYEERIAFSAGDTERRKVPAIGYGTLFDDDDNQHYDYTLMLDFALPDGADLSCVHQLEEMVENTVKQWLMDFAPKGTRTCIVAAVEE